MHSKWISRQNYFKLQEGVVGAFFEPHPWNSGNLLLFTRCTNHISFTFWIFWLHKSCKKCWSLPLQVFRASCPWPPIDEYCLKNIKYLDQVFFDLIFAYFLIINYRNNDIQTWQRPYYKLTWRSQPSSSFLIKMAEFTGDQNPLWHKIGLMNAKF